MRSADRRVVQDKLSFTEEARRAQIVQHAIATIAEIGYAQASFEQIARRAGISRSLISYHFTGRDELMEQVLAAVYTTGEKFMTPRIAAARTATDALEAYVRGNIAFIDAHRDLVAAGMSIVLNARKQDLSARPEAEPAGPRVAGMRRILEWGQATGEFRSFSTVLMAITVLQGIDGAYQVRDAGLDLSDYADELMCALARATTKEPDG